MDIYLCTPSSLGLYRCLKVKVKSLSRIWLFATPWTVAYQAPLSMKFSRQEYWSGLPFPPAGDLPDPGTEPVCPALTGGFFTTVPPGKPSLQRYTNWSTRKLSDLSKVSGILSLETGFEPRQHLTWDLLSIAIPYFHTQERANTYIRNYIHVIFIEMLM